MSGPVILLKAVDYSGSGAWLDATANHYDATLQAGTIAKNAAGNGIVLDGSTYWTFPNVAAGNAWTASVWYKNTGGFTQCASIITEQVGTHGMNIVIGNLNSDSVTMLCGFDTNGDVFYGNDITSYLSIGTWVNIQATWDGTNIKTYINGALLGTTSAVGTAYDSGTPYNIGRRWDANNFVTGEIGEVRIYDYAIDQAKVTADYNSSYGTYYITVPRIFIRPRAEYTAVEVWWREPLNNGGYDIAHYTISCLDQTFSPLTLAYPATNCYITGLTSLTAYTFQIVAVNTNGDTSTEAVFRTVKTDVRPAKPATGSAGTMYTDGSVVISWTPTTNTTCVGYAIILEPVGGGTLVKASAYSDSSSLYVTGLTPTNSYTCNIYTVNDAGWSAPTSTDPIANAL